MKKLFIIPVLLMFINSNGQSFNDALNTSGGNSTLENLNGLSNIEMATLTGNPGEWSKIMKCPQKVRHYLGVFL